MNKDIELIREAADIIGASWYTQPRHFGLLRSLADRLEAQVKQEPVGFARDDKFGGIELHLTDHGYLTLKHRDTVFTYPPDTAARIAELKAENAQLKIKHQVACDTVATMKADREIRHKNCVSTEQYVATTTEAANEFNAHHEAMLQKVAELEVELEVRKDCHDHLLDTANQLSASRDELEAQLAEYKKDAERYCFQRDADFRYFPPLCYWEDKTHNTSGKANTYEEAIDAAIAKAKP